MKGTILFLALVTSIISCDKKDDNGPAPAAPASFTFSVNGGTSITADTKRMEYNSGSGKWVILATKGTAGSAVYYSIDISVAGSTVGNYPVTQPSPAPGISYIFITDANDVGSFSSGSVNITAKTHSKISGTFTGTGGNHPAVTSISGSFTDVPIY